MRELTHVIEASPGFKVPTAKVLSGSVVVHIAWGITRWHALGRAAKWAKRHGADGSLRVARWHNQDGEEAP